MVRKWRTELGIKRGHSANEGAFKAVVSFIDAVPAPVHRGNQGYFFIAGVLALILGYVIPNRYYLFEPHYLDLLFIDQVTPVVPWTIIIYFSEYIYFFVAFFMMKRDVTKNRYMWSLLTTQFVATIFFVFFPTTYPRDLFFPLPPGTNEIFVKAFELLHSMDTPANSFPSLHVGACFVTAFIFIKEKPWQLLFMTTWASAVAVSTMTTKQHYFADVVAGLLLASLTTYVFVIRAKYRPTVGAMSARIRENALAKNAPASF